MRGISGGRRTVAAPTSWLLVFWDNVTANHDAIRRRSEYTRDIMNVPDDNGGKRHFTHLIR